MRREDVLSQACTERRSLDRRAASVPAVRGHVRFSSGMNAGSWRRTGKHAGERGGFWIGHGCQTRTRQQFERPADPTPIYFRFMGKSMSAIGPRRMQSMSGPYGLDDCGLRVGVRYGQVFLLFRHVQHRNCTLCFVHQTHKFDSTLVLCAE